MALGRKTGGRVKGSVNRLTTNTRVELGPLIELAKETARKILTMTLECSVCRGIGKTKFQPKGGGDGKERICQSCWGSGFEQIRPDLRGRIASDVIEYGHPKQRAIEVSGSLEVTDGRGARIRAKRLALREARKQEQTPQPPFD